MSFKNSKQTAETVTNFQVANDPTLKMKGNGFATIKRNGQRVWVRIMVDQTITRMVKKAIVDAIDFTKFTMLKVNTKKAGAVTRYELVGPESVINSVLA